MKKVLFLLFAVLFAATSFAQGGDNIQEDTESPYSYYVAAGISLTNFNSTANESSTFNSTSYASAEIGVMRDNIAVAGVFGISSLHNADSYWYEGKVMISQPLGVVDGYGVLGLGSYVDDTSLFLEYGVGVAKEFNGWGVFAQFSNWDAVNYISTGVSVSLF
jgi:hypothetical protein